MKPNLKLQARIALGFIIIFANEIVFRNQTDDAACVKYFRFSILKYITKTDFSTISPIKKP